MTSQTSLVALPASRVSPMPARATVCCLAVLGLFSVMLLHPAVLNDPDTYWHLATGC